MIFTILVQGCTNTTKETNETNQNNIKYSENTNKSSDNKNNKNEEEKPVKYFKGKHNIPYVGTYSIGKDVNLDAYVELVKEKKDIFYKGVNKKGEPYIIVRNCVYFTYSDEVNPKKSRKIQDDRICIIKRNDSTVDYYITDDRNRLKQKMPILNKQLSDACYDAAQVLYKHTESTDIWE